MTIRSLLILALFLLGAIPVLAQECVDYRSQEMTILDTLVLNAYVTYDIEIRGSVGYVGTSNGIYTIDLSDLNNLTTIGYFQQFGCISIALIDGLICVASQDDGVIFIDGTNPAAMSLVASFPEHTSVQDVIAHGDHFYVGNNHLGVLTFSATDPANPQLMSSVDTDEAVTHLVAQGNVLYTVGFNNPLISWNITNRDLPSVMHVSSNYSLRRGYDLLAVGSTLYMPNYTYSMQVINIQNPATPYRVGQVSTNGPSYSLAIQGDHLFAAGEPSLLAFGMQNPLAPEPVGHMISGLTYYDLENYGDNLVAVAEDNRIVSLDVSQPESTLPLAVSYAHGNPQDITFRDGIGYVANGWDGLYIRTVDSGTPLSITEFPGFLHSVTLDYPWAYLALDETGVQIISVANPQAIELFDSINTTGHARDVAIYQNASGKYAMVADTEYDFVRYDVTDPWDIRPKGLTYFVGEVHDVEVVGDRVLIADTTGLLHVMDVSLLPDQPQLVTTLEVQGSVTKLQVVGDILFAAGGNQLSSVDISDTDNPVLLDTHQLRGGSSDIEIHNGLAYCSLDSWGMEIVDVTDPLNLFRLKTVQTVSDPTGVGIGGDTVFLTADYETLVLLPLQCRASPAPDLPDPRETNYLAAAYPNPFNPSTTFSYRLPASLPVDLRVYDLQGRLVDTLVSGEIQAEGIHRVNWLGADSRGQSVGAGVYLYRLQAGSIDETRRVVLLK